MSARRSKSRRPRGHGVHIVVVGAIVAVLVVGTIGGIVADRSHSRDASNSSDIDLQSTPGAEIARLRTRVAETPDDIDALIVLAEILANSGRESEAIPLFESAVNRRPSDATLRLAFGRTLLRTQNLFDAEIQLRRAVELAPNDQAGAFYLAQTYEAGGARHFSDAREWYQLAIDLAPESLIAEQARQALERIGSPGTSTPADQGSSQ